MTNEKKTIYARAYVELYELISNLTEQERENLRWASINSPNLAVKFYVLPRSRS